MEKERFVDRERELEFLEEAYREARAQLIIIYGRRRVGKSYLLTHFKAGKPSVYYLCSKGNEAEQINFISRTFGEFFDDKALLLNPFDDWHSLFTYVYEKTKNKRIVWIIDEFPFLVNANPAITSIFQKYWDEYFSKTKIMFVLCGSSIGMMESETLAYRSPLYGRRTGQWKIEPLKFKDEMKFFPRKDLEKIVEFCSITGGIPFYLVELDLRKTALENIEERIAKKGKVLYEEGEFLIKEELKEPTTYFSILNAIAAGKTRQTEVANAIGIPSTTISRYLSTLIKLGFIERLTPVTEKPRSKKALYRLSDNFLDFWFKFIYPSKGYIEADAREPIKRTLSKFNLHVSKIFERVAAEALGELREKKLVFDFQKIGKWWGGYRDKSGARKVAEIDIIALKEQTKEILFVECKWRGGVDAKKVLEELREKSKFVDWNKNKRKEYYAIFAKSFERKIGGEDVFYYDVKDIEKVFEK